MSERRRRPEDESDAWFYDLGLMARRIEANECTTRTTVRRQWVVVSFVIFAFLMLAWRSEIASDRIDRANQRIQQTQYQSCLGGSAILVNFNIQQDRLIAIARENPRLDPKIQERLVEAYTAAKAPLRDCERLRP